MASALELAGALRALDPDELRARLESRIVARPTQVKDAFDLADALLEPASIRDALSRLDRVALLALQAARSPADATALVEAADPAFTVTGDDAERAGRRLVDLLLALRDAGTGVVATLDGVGVVLDEDPALSRDSLADTRPPVVLEAVDAVDRDAQNAVSAERLFGVVTEVAEIVRAVTEAPARELAKGGLALPETRRLSEAARIDVDDVAPLLAAARAADLVESGRDGWGPGPAAADWLSRSWADRWADLVGRWLATLPHEIRTVLDQRADTSWGEPLRTFTDWFFPAGSAWIPERLASFTRSAELFGLTVASRPTGVAAALLHDGVDAARGIVDTLMPAPIDSVYLQHDLTAVAPGPLDPALDSRLRSIAEVESTGLAATYRISEAGIQRALGDGDTEESLREFLTALSSTGIPQPVDYLLTQTAARHGRYRVSTLEAASAGRAGLDPEALRLGAVSQLRADDPALLDTVEVDQALSPLGLRRVEPLRMLCRFDAETVYWALTDERYPVVVEGADQQPLRSPQRRKLRRAPQAAAQDPLADLIARVASTSVGDADDTDRAWISRQLDAAVKGRLTVLLTVAMPDGSTSELQMEPTGVGGGRVRGRDRKSDIERTLPLSSIVQVQASPR